MVAVSNSGPLIALARINKLSLLKHFFKQIHITPATQTELLKKGKRKAGYRELKDADWIQTIKPKNKSAVNALQLELDAGEAETIVLAQELKAKVVLLDEYISREIAKSLGLNVCGSIGILIKAKKKGLITRVKPLLNKLRKKKVWISEELYQKALKLAREA